MWQMWIIEGLKIIFVWAALDALYGGGDLDPNWLSGGYCDGSGCNR